MFSEIFRGTDSRGGTNLQRVGMLREKSEPRFKARRWNSTAHVRSLGELRPTPIDAIANSSHPPRENAGRPSGAAVDPPNRRAQRSSSWMLIAATFLHDMAEVLKTLGGKLLVVDEPKTADLILVLSGERWVRVQQAIRLLVEGWAPRIVITTDANWQIYSRSETQLAEEFVGSLPPAWGSATHVLPVAADSTSEEAAEIGKYMDAVGAHSALLVTSEYHTRRALSVFRRLLPEKEFGISGAPDPVQFGMRWWRRRAWTKRALNEAIRLVWWSLIDRWSFKQLPHQPAIPAPPPPVPAETVREDERIVIHL